MTQDSSPKIWRVFTGWNYTVGIGSAPELPPMSTVLSRRYQCGWMAVAILTLLQQLSSAQPRPPLELTAPSKIAIGNYQLVSAQAEKRGGFNYTYRASITNIGPALANVSAVLVGVSGDIRIIDGSLTFGNVPAGATVLSQDTFTLEARPRTPFVPSDLHWKIQATPINNAPVAIAGADQVVAVGVQVQLNGAGSSDPDGNALTYIWTFLSKPAGSAAALLSAAAVMPTFVADRPGTYVVQLVVNDASINSAPSTVTIETQNRQPIANAGADQTQDVLTTVHLDASRSSDADGDQLAFSWTFVSKPGTSSASLSDPGAVNPSFVIDEEGTYVVALRVDDGTDKSRTDVVTIDTRNSAPVANAGGNQTARIGTAVHLNGTGSSDVDGNSLAYYWRLQSAPRGSKAVLSGATDPMPTFMVDRPGTYVAQLVVEDGQLRSAPSVVIIDTKNTRPVSNAGRNQKSTVAAKVELDGSGSTDVDGNLLSYSWSFSSRPRGSNAKLSDSSSVVPSFVVDQPGVFVAQLIVNDGSADSLAATVKITTSTSAPLAQASPDQTVVVGQLALLDGTGSTDIDGDPLTYLWSIVSRPAQSEASLPDAQSVLPNFVVDKPGTYVAQLIVNDGTADSAPHTVTIRTNYAGPVARPSFSLTTSPGKIVQLDGSPSSDPDSDLLTYLVGDPLEAGRQHSGVV